MDAPTISILPYALWPLLTLATVALWMSAMADITRHRRRGTFTRAGLVCMAAAVSAVAVIALAGIGAVFAGQRSEAVSRTGSQADEHGAARTARIVRCGSRSSGVSLEVTRDPTAPVSDESSIASRVGRLPAAPDARSSHCLPALA